MKLNASDVMCVPLNIQHTGAVASTLYKSKAMAKQIILIAESEAASIVQVAECNIVVMPEDLHGLVDAIKFLKNGPGSRKQMDFNGR